MRVLLINSVCGIGSTGRICTDLAQDFEKAGHEVRIAYGRDPVPDEHQKYAVRIGTDLEVMLHGLRSRAFDAHGLGSTGATKRFLRWAQDYDPDLLWLHNIHGYYMNYKLLFQWIKSRPFMKVRWTLHDCWAFTGHCSYFSAVKCDKWKGMCSSCPQKGKYPASLLFDRSRRNYILKKTCFTSVKNMTIITPSVWLANLVKQSYLKEYEVEVHYNTIDRQIFKPTPSSFAKEHGISDKKIVLGVASVWDDRKGLRIFFRLSSTLSEDYIIVLVGLNDRQIMNAPKNILALKRTNDISELAKIYSAADVFVNPSLEETFGLTTVEAIACGTKAIVYKGTACEEIAEQFGGIAVEQKYEDLVVAIIDAVNN